jgi:hypothetical protein
MVISGVGSGFNWKNFLGMPSLCIAFLKGSRGGKGELKTTLALIWNFIIVHYDTDVIGCFI